MTPSERLAQHHRRIRIWSRRCLRLIHDGKADAVDGDWDRRSLLREFQLAYEDGFRAGRAAVTEGKQT